MPSIRSTASSEDLYQEEAESCPVDDDSSSSSDLDDVPDDPGEDDEGEEKESLDRDSDHMNVVWTGVGKKIPIILFSASDVIKKNPVIRQAGEKYHMTFKIVKTECKLVRSIFQAHGFHETHASSPDYNVIWTGCHLKPYMLRSMSEYQKINHFPRSYELTRKDRLFKNVQRMQHIKGAKHFDFVPASYVLPSEYQDFCSAFLKDKGPYIVKPVASSRGRGIFLCSHPDQIPLDEQLICSKYVANPYLVDGFKFDLRIYVAVTSYDPLTIYMYEEGLTRFATVKYQSGGRFLKTNCMHLTNYSVNKKSNGFVQNDDADVEDFGNKWSLGALLRYLRAEGKDTAALMMRIEDVVIKSILSVESHVATACKMFQPARGVCFELYGFDIMLDELLRPWLLEVNLSPSLACDSPLDFKIKSYMMSDLFSLIGIVCQDPMLRSGNAASKRTTSATSWNQPSGPANSPYQRRPSPLPTRASSVGPGTGRGNKPPVGRGRSKPSSGRPGTVVGSTAGLTADEVRMIRRGKEEYQRRGGWIRIFPSRDSWEMYSMFLQSSGTANVLLHQHLYPSFWQSSEQFSGDSMTRSSSTSSAFAYLSSHSSNGILPCRAKIPLHSLSTPMLEVSIDSSTESQRRVNDIYEITRDRMQYYERKLGTPPMPRSKRVHVNRSMSRGSKKRNQSLDSDSGAPKSSGLFRGNLVKPEEYEEPVVAPDAELEQQSTVDIEEKFSDTQGASQNSGSMAETKVSSSQEPYVRDTTTQHAQPPLRMPMPSTSLQRLSVTSEQDSCVRTSTRDHSTHKVIANGGKLNKIQARQTFAAYLASVQKRLLIESHSDTPSINEDGQSSDEQMDLVLRFLRRAAGNLNQEFRVTIPSRKLPLPQRKHILATMLSEFIRLYRKETDGMKLSQSSSQDSDKGIAEDDFIMFIRHATEGELERILTNYTVVNKSAGLFINSREPPIRTVKVSATTSEQKLSPSTDSGFSSKDCLGDEEQGHLRMQRGSRPMSSHMQRGLQAAAIVYSQRLQRPTSASSLRSSGSQSRLSRPSSASSIRKAYAYGTPQVETYDDDAIDAALQRISVHQQARQYAAYKVNAVLTREQKQAAGPSISSAGTYSRPQSAAKDVWSMNPAAQSLLQQFHQSRALLEQSRAKHDALLSQAAISSSQQQSKNPRPPAGPKPSSSATVQRGVKGSSVRHSTIPCATSLGE